MKKDEFNSELRAFAHTLSPKQHECDLISKIYESFCELLGHNCLQVGSYPRFTSISPVHDLDILFVLGEWFEAEHDPYSALQEILKRIRSDYSNPTEYTIRVGTQTHSITVSYFDNDIEVFSVDIVPAYIYGKNEFGLDKYKVPEVLKERHGEKRQMYYQKLNTENRQMAWINSDPRGYIKIATDIDAESKGDFRRATKLIKHWKNNLFKADEHLKLKSFHLEQVMVGYFTQDSTHDVFDATFNIFCVLPQILRSPNTIADRANSNLYIDDYLADFTEKEIDLITQARDGLLIKLESFKEGDSIEDIFEIQFHDRACISEQYLFDEKIPTLISESVCINGLIQKEYEDFRRLSSVGVIDNGQKIRFESFMGPSCDLYKWKVKNDDRSSEPRGEITDHQTKNSIERTVYPGNHYVECFAIKNGICIAKAKQHVIINR